MRMQWAALCVIVGTSADAAEAAAQGPLRQARRRERRWRLRVWLRGRVTETTTADFVEYVESVLEGKRAEDIARLDVRGVTDIADEFLIATINNSRQSPPEFQLFTVLVIVFGLTASAYAFTGFIQFLLAGEIERIGIAGLTIVIRGDSISDFASRSRTSIWISNRLASMSRPTARMSVLRRRSATTSRKSELTPG